MYKVLQKWATKNMSTHRYLQIVIKMGYYFKNVNATKHHYLQVVTEMGYHFKYVNPITQTKTLFIS